MSLGDLTFLLVARTSVEQWVIPRVVAEMMPGCHPASRGRPSWLAQHGTVPIGCCSSAETACGDGRPVGLRRDVRLSDLRNAAGSSPDGQQFSACGLIDDLPPERLVGVHHRRAHECRRTDPCVGEGRPGRKRAGMPIVEGQPDRSRWKRDAVDDSGDHLLGADGTIRLADQ